MGPPCARSDPSRNHADVRDRTVLSRVTAGRILLAIGIVGIVTSIAAVLVGRALIGELDRALDRSLVLTGDAVAALRASIEVAEQTAALVDDGLVSATETTRELGTTLDEGAELLDSTATLTEERLAGSIEAVEEGLPALIQVAAVIDRTLTTLAALPFGPAYDPGQRFDDSLRQIQASLDGVPDDLREQAELIRGAGANLAEVGAGTEAVADDLQRIQQGLTGSIELLRGYAATATSASELIGDTQRNLGLQVRLARLLVTLLGVVFAAGQIVPLGLGWTLLQPPGGRLLLRETAVMPPVRDQAPP
jgi:hypothetical protein